MPQYVQLMETPTDTLTITSNGTYDVTNYASVNIAVVDPTKAELTEGEFILICQNNLQSQMTKGAIITLENSYQTQWEVIGVDHDGTTNTVDIMSHTNISAQSFGSSLYTDSNVHTFCNVTIPNAFTNVTTKSLIKSMDVISNGETLTDQKGKALSCTEINYSASNIPIEGTNYGFSDYLFRSGVSGYIWTRTYAGGSNWAVVSSGPRGYYFSNSFGVLPVLRF